VSCLVAAILVTVIQERTLGESIEFTADKKKQKVRNCRPFFYEQNYQ